MRFAWVLLCSAAFSQTLIRNVRVFDGDGMLTPVSVLIEGGNIRALSDRIEVKAAIEVDGTGKTLLPGLIDALGGSSGFTVASVATGADVQEALQAGATVLRGLPAGALDLRRARGVAWIPLLAKSLANAGEDQRRERVAVVRRMHEAGVVLLAGAGEGGTIPGELAALVEAGLTPLEALASATSRPARIFHLTGRGRIAPGLRADLVLVDGDPSVDIGVAQRVTAVWENGLRLHK